MKEDLKAFTSTVYVAGFPPEAKNWLISIGLKEENLTVLPHSGWIRVRFEDLKTANFYARRWNGRMGQNWLKFAAHQQEASV